MDDGWVGRWMGNRWIEKSLTSQGHPNKEKEVGGILGLLGPWL